MSPPSANAPVGALHRAYGFDPASVARSIGTVVPAMQAQHVSATLKHFPGLGRMRYNPDTSSLASDPIASSTDPNLAPFAAGIRAGARAVMVASARYPRLDVAQPALLSEPIVTGLLQEQLGFRGLIVSDDIGAAAALRSIALAQRAIGFIDAGGQLVLSVRPADAGPLSRGLVAHALADGAFRLRVDAAVARVVQSKVDAGVVLCPRYG
jgi:beta-N-acetylhexosaminidase